MQQALPNTAFEGPGVPDARDVPDKVHSGAVEPPEEEATSHGHSGRAPDSAPFRASAFRTRLVFDGQGAEYFRIWVVNLLLTLLTLGAYSAWAKVRKARWFAQHTSLLGDRFDYHGDPWRILAGRVLGLLLLAGWTWAFDLSVWLGWAVLGLLLVAGPALFAGAQRFKLANTSWRGLRFGFQASRLEIYQVCLPLLVLWTLGSAMSHAGVPDQWVLWSSVPLILLLPWAHARLKRLQHARASYGDRAFSFEPAGKALYGLYIKGLLMAAVVTIAGAVLILLASAFILDRNRSAAGRDEVFSLVLTSALVCLLLWVLVWPWFAARAQQIVWGHTRLAGGVGFAGQMRGGTLCRLVMRQMLFTVLTAGLYWPFAAVAIARYRIESLMIVSDIPLSEVSVHAAPLSSGPAAGDASADLFGLDLGW